MIYFRQVTLTEAKKFCDDCKLQYVEVSAVDGKNIKKLFETITACLYESQHFLTNKDKTIILDKEYKPPEVEKKKNCCPKN